MSRTIQLYVVAGLIGLASLFLAMACDASVRLAEEDMAVVLGGCSKACEFGEYCNDTGCDFNYQDCLTCDGKLRRSGCYGDHLDPNCTMSTKKDGCGQILYGCMCEGKRCKPGTSCDGTNGDCRRYYCHQ